MKKWISVLLPSTLIVLPAVIELVYIQRFAVNVPFWDEWLFVPLLRTFRQHGDWLPLAWDALNEHRMLFPKLLFLALSQASNWNVVIEMYLSWLMAVGSLLGLGLLYIKTSSRSLWRFVPVAWLIFSLGQYENILYGMQMAFYLYALAIIWAVYFLSVKSYRSIILAAGCGIVASLSFSSGLLIWPVGLLCLAAIRAGKKQMLIWGILGIIVIAIYFFGYVAPPHPTGSTTLSQLLTTLAFLSANVGAPLGGGDLNWSLIAGIYLLILFVVFLINRLILRKRGAKTEEADFTLGSLVLLSLLSSGAITFGRAGYGLESALSSRYTTLTSLGVIGIYLLLSRQGQEQAAGSHSNWLGAKWLSYTLLPAILIGLVLTNLFGIKLGIIMYEAKLRMEYTLQPYELQSDSALATLYAYPSSVRIHATYLKDEQLNVFSEPVTVVLPSSYDQGRPAGEILPGQPVVQQFRCPVTILQDFSALLAKYGHDTTSSFEITLKSSNLTLLDRVISSTAIRENDWVRLSLPAPIESCAGQDFTLKIASQDAIPGNAITIWTFPRYYEGELQKPHGEPWSSRVIGLELNTGSIGISD